MKKIVFVLPTLRCGGAEQVTVTLAKLLPITHYNIVFLTVGEGKGELYDRITDTFPLISLNKKGVKFAFLTAYKWIKKEKPDYVFSSLVHTSLLILILSCFLNFKSVVRIPSMPSNKLYKTLKSKFLILLERILYNRATIIITQTDAMRIEAIRTYNLKKEKVFTLINPLDREFIDLKAKDIDSPFKHSNSLKILAIGSVIHIKGFDVLINAFKDFLMSFPNANLYILGRLEGEYAKKIQLIADSCDNVHLEGFIPNPYPYIKNCDIFVLSSRMEGLPNVLLEALYFKRKIIATKCVPFIEEVIIDGKNGYKVDVDNTYQMAEALTRVTTMKYEEHLLASHGGDFNEMLTNL